jgi:hypothetical protein
VRHRLHLDVDSTHSSIGNGEGDTDDDRCVRLRKPRQTSDDVPSGKTSHSFTDTDATGCDERSRRCTRGCPSSDIPSAGHSQPDSDRQISSARHA